jgi:hypothetical protein
MRYGDWALGLLVGVGWAGPRPLGRCAALGMDGEIEKSIITVSFSKLGQNIIFLSYLTHSSPSRHFLIHWLLLLLVGSLEGKLEGTGDRTADFVDLISDISPTHIDHMEVGRVLHYYFIKIKMWWMVILMHAYLSLLKISR